MSQHQTALHLIQRLRALLACEGWHAGLAAHLQQERDRLAARILDDDDLPPAARESLRIAYKVYRDLILWPARTLESQISILEAATADSRNDISPGNSSL